MYQFVQLLNFNENYKHSSDFNLKTVPIFDINIKFKLAKYIFFIFKINFTLFVD